MLTPPLPGLWASASRPLPRAFLCLLFALLAFTGLVGRGPWQGDDLQGVAQARAAFQSLQQDPGAQRPPLWVPSLGVDLILPEEGPLPAVLGAGVLQVKSWVDGLQDRSPTVLDPQRHDDLIRLLQPLFLGLGLWGVWGAAGRLAQRREAKPTDPLGIGPDASRYGRALGDAAVLLVLACLGAVVRWHEAGSFAISFALQALLLWALSAAPEYPRRSGALAGVLAGGLFLTDGLEGLAAVVLGMAVLLWMAQPWRLVARRVSAHAVGLLSITLAAWLIALSARGEWPAALVWLNAQVTMEPSRFLKAPQEWLWAWWPLWPLLLALLATQGRGLLRGMAPHLWVPLGLLIGQVLLAVLVVGEQDPRRLLGVAPLAILAAFGLLNLPRRITSLMDWSGLAFFTSLAALIWLTWSAAYLQAPSNLALRVDALAPGFAGEPLSLRGMALGLVATVAWVGLLMWRLGRGSAQLWRPLAISLGGVCLCWVLLIQLLSSGIEKNRGYNAIGASLNETLARVAPISEKDLALAPCIRAPQGDVAARRVVLGLAHLPIGTHCPLLLITAPASRHDLGPGRAVLLWSGRKPRERAEEDTYQLYRVGIAKN